MVAKTELIGQNNVSIKKGPRVIADNQSERQVPQYTGKTVKVNK